MEPETSRKQNRRVALWVALGMAAMAGLATAFMLRTTAFRREVDRAAPKAPPRC